jgi:hypothetical protein
VNLGHDADNAIDEALKALRRFLLFRPKGDASQNNALREFRTSPVIA